MSVWPKPPSAAPSLSGREGDLSSISIGDLILISINVDPRRLELLLETLAQVSFPVNPQIYHDAAIVSRYTDGREETEITTLVEFPAYGGQLDEVQAALESRDFARTSLRVTSMLEEIQSETEFSSPPPENDRVARYRVKHRAAGVH